MAMVLVRGVLCAKELHTSGGNQGTTCGAGSIERRYKTQKTTHKGGRSSTLLRLLAGWQYCVVRLVIASLFCCLHSIHPYTHCRREICFSFGIGPVGFDWAEG